MESFSGIIDVLDVITILFSTLTLVFVVINFFYNLYARKKENQLIKILIIKDGVEKQLPIGIPRKQISRSEVLGMLGVFDKQSYFEIAYTSKKEFFDQITEIQNNKKDVLRIYLQPNDEFDCSL